MVGVFQQIPLEYSTERNYIIRLLLRLKHRVPFTLNFSAVGVKNNNRALKINEPGM